MESVTEGISMASGSPGLVRCSIKAAVNGLHTHTGAEAMSQLLLLDTKKCSHTDS